ncbi:MAG: hypothetical protein CNE97_05315 [alpha proteobacterium MED-G10]|mgnify:FL=1|jgi:cob(I)alamin adenosyltransferase|nr:hypothetical protein [Rickettsiales bacterium]PDH54392.1 MAG: hypothetical protein CNE97_05315 [alpha proteobacterium MED-G10]|tara:strand:- start:588 stop:860 length:273 start_codon:yes stop_codon:yes gene_type:complete
MEKYLDDLIRILEESLSNQDFNKTTELEKKLQNLTEDFRKTQDSPSQEIKIDETKINHLSLLIKKFEANQEERKNFLTEFDDFLKTRKFK